MQYTASSFAQLFMTFARRLLLPRVQAPVSDSLFPGPGRLHTHVPDPVLDRVLLPVLRGLAFVCNQLRMLQRGRIHVYLLYILLTLLFLLLLLP